MRLKILPILVTLISTVSLSHGQALGLDHAITETPPPQIQPNIILTQFSLKGDFIEIYNQSSSPVELKKIHIKLVAAGNINQQELNVNMPEGWILSKTYVLLHSNFGASNVLPLDVDTSYDIQNLESIIVAVGSDDYRIDTTAATNVSWYQHKQRGNASLKISKPNAFADYSPKNTSPLSLADPVYQPIRSPGGLKIIEILINANSCAPNVYSVECNDYIKLINNSSDPVDLSGYRLRTNSGGSKSSASNTFGLEGEILPGQILLVTLKDNGEPLSITNTGGYTWLEDIEGVVVYDDTVVQYPDASNTANTGMSWAWDKIDNSWRWMVPAPYGDNYWSMKDDDGLINDCGLGKERNPETNRCRNIVITMQVECKPGQERNPVTGRCKSSTSASSSQKPCSKNQVRNPSTGRCKNIQSTNSPAPCKPNQERNPATGRCKKKIKGANELSKVEDLASGKVENRKILIYAGAALVVATGYGLYEWRYDLRRKVNELKLRLKR